VLSGPIHASMFEQRLVDDNRTGLRLRGQENPDPLSE